MPPQGQGEVGQEEGEEEEVVQGEDGVEEDHQLDGRVAEQMKGYTLEGGWGGEQKSPPTQGYVYE